MYRAFAIACSMIAGWSAAARADVQYCNGADVPIFTAIMYSPQTNYDPNTNYLRTVTGWWRLEPKECRTVLHGPVTGSGYYAMAISADGRLRWEGDSDLTQSCHRQGLQLEAYLACSRAIMEKSGLQQVVCVDYNEAFRYVECPSGGAAQNWRNQCPANHPAYSGNDCKGRYKLATFGLASRNDHNPEVSRRMRDGGFYVRGGSGGNERSSTIDTPDLTHRYLFHTGRY